MNPKSMIVRIGNASWDCQTVVLVGAAAVERDGHITMLSANTGSNTKHEFYALAQTALIQFQDGELEVQPINAPVAVQRAHQINEMASGMIVCRTSRGRLHVMAHEGLPWRKLLEAVHRYCARWIRLDVR